MPTALGQRPQTNVQLDRLLAATGTSEADRLRVRDAYGLATQLFSGALRPSGRPLLVHVVGTAGILAQLRQPPELVVAGLLHAAYPLGDFGTERSGRRRRATPAKRARVRAVVGPRSEELVHAYPRLPWSAERIHGWARAPERLEPQERELALVRLANELDENLDLGPLYSPKWRDGRETLAAAPALARALRHADLADALEGARRELATARVPAALRGTDAATTRVRPAASQGTGFAGWLRRRLAGGPRPRARGAG